MKVKTFIKQPIDKSIDKRYTCKSQKIYFLKLKK